MFDLVSKRTAGAVRLCSSERCQFGVTFDIIIFVLQLFPLSSIVGVVLRGAAVSVLHLEHNFINQYIAYINTDHVQLEYRLRTCGELCSGIFTSGYPTTSGPVGEILKTRKFPSIDSHNTDRKRILLGHIISTKSSARLVTDEAMDYPKDWKIKYQLSPSTGHNEDGDTICIHSLCVHPDFQRKGFGQILLKAYVQRIKDSGIAKRISLICRDRFVGYYEKAGFSKIGPSKCQYGGGNWVDMVLEFESEWEDDDGGY